MLRYLTFAFPLIFILVFSTQCSNSYRDGKYIYDKLCKSCHMEDGSGLKSMFPPLAGSDFLENNFEKLPCIILLGMDEEIDVNGKKYTRQMPAFPDLETHEVFLLINYINHSWGNDGKYTDFREVEANLQKCN